MTHFCFVVFSIHTQKTTIPLVNDFFFRRSKTLYFFRVRVRFFSLSNLIALGLGYTTTVWWLFRFHSVSWLFIVSILRTNANDKKKEEVVNWIFNREMNAHAKGVDIDEMDGIKWRMNERAQQQKRQIYRQNDVTKRKTNRAIRTNFGLVRK